MKNVCLNNYSVVNFGARQRGASLLEGIAYLGIAALVVLGAVSLLTSAFSSAQSNRGAEEIVSIRTGVRKLYTGQAGSYGTVDITANLYTAGVFPSTLAPNTTPPTAMYNAWGGGVTVTGATTTFIIAYPLVPKEACIGMVSGANGWEKIQEGATAGTIITGPGAATAAQAIALCANPTNTINFTAK